jgi:nickel-type superoxide dismutase maturation protease
VILAGCPKVRARPLRGVSVVGALVLLAALSWVRPRRVVVAGASMEPTLSAGDRLLVGNRRSAKVGDIVALKDPMDRRRVIVKRITAVRLHDVVVRGDNAEASVDSRSFGPVPKRAVIGKVLRRYGPPSRARRLR